MFSAFNALNVHVYGRTEIHRQKGSGLEPWPQRLSAAPPRLEEIGVSPEVFKKDSVRILSSGEHNCLLANMNISFLVKDSVSIIAT